jgi:hypothetical protein
VLIEGDVPSEKTSGDRLEARPILENQATGSGDYTNGLAGV